MTVVNVGSKGAIGVEDTNDEGTGDGREGITFGDGEEAGKFDTSAGLLQAAKPTSMKPTNQHGGR
ncbi:MAG: hypothetical protein NZ772_17885 [Cyanobacteria bacterium]|nr:hypothetical protein [Cyanobacteriota bacterium]MDW8202722.1 hypothetical protein [Cyanobacteriota bacterium SKYGB_h_bin112]